MKQNSPYFLFLFLCFCGNMFVNAQQQNDSLAKYSYEELRAMYHQMYYDDLEKTEEISRTYLVKAKKENDTIKIARGYFYMSTVSSEHKGLLYADSIINISKNKEHKSYPAIGYYMKGAHYYSLNKNEIALDNFIEAIKYLNKNKNLPLEMDTRSAIISIKSNWIKGGNIINERLKYIDFIKNTELYKTEFNGEYLNAIHNLSLEYIRNDQYENGLLAAKKGIKEFKENNSINYYEFVSDIGTVQYYLKNYQVAIDSLQKALPFKDDHGKAMSNYYLAKSYDKLSQPEKAHDYFLKVDFLYIKTQDVFPELRNTYEHIVDYYKEKGDTEQQLFFLERLIETDAKIDSVYKYVTETVQKKYETPQAIAERNRLLEEAQEKQNAWKYNFGIISAILIAILGVLVFVFRRQKYYKKRFEEVMSISAPLNVQNTSSEVFETRIERSRNALEEKKEIDIPEAIIESILKKLSKFEASKGYTKQLTLAQLAKKLGTNQKYLSKVINWHYKKSYSAYINDLRVHHVISKLKEETTFRNYTIKAIAEEVGFGNAAAFAKAFSKTTGINPSYFIKRLNERN